MPLSKEQLMIPRVLCIGTEDGKQNYPKSLFKSGQVLELDNISHDGRNCYVVPSYDIDYFLSYPNCFKPLPWWYGRTVEEMPEYVSHTLKGVTTYHKVLAWAWGGNGWLWEGVGDERGDFFVWSDHFQYQPATLEEYQEYQKQKQ